MLKWLKSFWEHFLVFLTGKARKFSAKEIKQIKELWRQLSPVQRQEEFDKANEGPPEDPRPKLHQKFRDTSEKRRGSISENFQRGNFASGPTSGFMAAIATFVIFNVQGFKLTLAFISLILFATAIVLILWTNSPKLGIFCKGETEPEAIRWLRTAVEKKQAEENDPELVGVYDFIRSGEKRLERDMINLVDRRALMLATIFFIVGLAAVVAALLT